MTITLHWQHWILLVGFIIPIVCFWIPYSQSGRDDYGIGALLVAGLTAIIWLITLVVFFCLGYFGAFK